MSSLSTVERADALAEKAYQSYLNTTGPGRQTTAAAATVTKLWQYYIHPEYLDAQCEPNCLMAYVVLFGLGLVCRMMLWVIVKVKVHKKSYE